MKNILIVLLIALCAITTYKIANSRMNVMIVGGGGATPATTTAANDACGDDMAYTSLWNGEYADHTDYMCVSNTFSDGELESTAAIDSAYAQGTGYGLRTTANNMSLQFTDIDPALVDKDLGTVWMSIKVPAPGEPPNVEDDTTIFEVTDGTTNNYVWLVIKDDDEYISGYYRGNTGAIEGQQGNDAIVVDGTTWNRVAYTWDRVSSIHCVQVGTNGWDCSSTDTLDEWSASLTKVVIGEDDLGSTTTQTVYYDNVYILSTYQAADPL